MVMFGDGRVVLHIEQEGNGEEVPFPDKPCGAHFLIDGDDWWVYDHEREAWVKCES